MVEGNKYGLKVGDKIKYKNIVYKILEIKQGEYVVLNKPCDDCNFCKIMDYSGKSYPMLFWEDLDYATKIEKRKESMEQRLQELKEKITSFVRDYDIEEFDIWIEEAEATGGKHFKTDKKVTLEIRV